MDQKLFRLECMHSEFHADFNAKKVFFKISHFQVNIRRLNFEFNFAIFRKCVGKKIKFSFFGSVFDTEKYGNRIFPKFKLFGN